MGARVAILMGQLAVVPLAQQIAIGLAGVPHVPKTDGLALNTKEKTKQLLY